MYLFLDIKIYIGLHLLNFHEREFLRKHLYIVEILSVSYENGSYEGGPLPDIVIWRY